MKKPGVLKRLTLTGRLQARLADIVNRVRFRELPRMDAGDLILSQVVRTIGRPKNRDERELLCDAELLRAQLYERSGGATPIEAAQALDAAFTWQLELPVNTARSERFAQTAQALVPRLERLGSRRTVCRLVRILLESWAETGVASARVLETLTELQDRVRRLAAVHEDPGITDLLYAAGRHRHVEGAGPIVRAVRREGLGVLLGLGEAREALAVESHLRILDREGSERLALLLADQGCIDADARRFYRETVEAWPEAAAGLSGSLRRLTHVGRHVDPATADAKERLSRALLPRFADEDWPYRNLAAIAAARGQADVAVAWFAGAVDRGGESADLVGSVAVALCSLGFDRVAESLVGRETVGEDGVGRAIRVLSRTEQALKDDLAPPERDRLIAELDDVIASRNDQDPLFGRATALRGRLHARSGRSDLAVRDLESALAHRRQDARLASELAECCIELGRLDRAREFVDRAEITGRSRRTLILRADIEAAAGNQEGVMVALEHALAVPDRTLGPKRELRGNWDLIAAAYETLGIGKASRSKFLRKLREECRGQDARTTQHADRLRRRAADQAHALGQPSREAALLAPLARRPDASRKRILRTAHAALRAGDVGLVSELSERLASRRADDPATHSLDGLLALRDGRAGEARRRLQVAIDAGCSDTTAHVALAMAYVMEGDADAALQILDGIDERSVAGRLRVLDLKALAFERVARHDDALACRAEALELDDDPARRLGFGRLAVTIALSGTADDDTRENLLRQGLDALSGADDVDSRALRALAALDLHQVPCGDDLIDAMAPDPRSVEPPVTLTVLRHALLKRHLELGDLAHAWRLLEILGVGSGDSEMSPPLKVLLARLHVADGGDLERARELVGDLTHGDGPVGAEARVVLALTHPQDPPQSFATDLAACAPVVFPAMASAPLEATRALREAVESGADEDSLAPLITRATDVASALGVAPELCERLSNAPTDDVERRLRVARQLIAGGDPETAEHELQELFGRVSDDRETARHVINLLHEAQEARAKIGDDYRLRAVTQAFESGRFRDVLDWTGGLTPDAGLDHECSLLRVRALSAQGDAERAASELDAVTREAARCGRPVEALSDLRSGVLIATLRRVLPEDGHEALRLWRIGERRRCLDELRILCERYPEHLAPALAYACALESEGYEKAAAEARQEARRRADHDVDLATVLTDLVARTEVPS